MPNEPVAGFALLCDAGGTVTRLLRDELGLAGGAPEGRPLALVVDRASFGKALGFLAEVRAKQAAFGWEMNVPIGQAVVSLHFGGAVIADQLLVVGAQTSGAALQLYEDMMRIEHEQVNALRLALKERSEMAHAQVERDATFYDELSRLNNELANLQRELSKKNVELERLNEQKNQFLGMAAHDLRNPLGVIQGFSEFLLAEAAPSLDEEHVEFLTIIHDSSEFMLKMVNDLLDVSKIESGRLQLDLVPTDLAALVAHNVALNRALAARKQIEIACQGSANLPLVEIDGAKLNQVLNNLIGNAVKFSHPQSSIVVSLARAGDEILLAVADEGLGIPEDELGKLFRPFGTTSVRGTGGEGSTGLGLAIARRIVLGHGGRIWVESQVGRGSTFYVALPLDGAV